MGQKVQEKGRERKGKIESKRVKCTQKGEKYCDGKKDASEVNIYFKPK